MNPGCLLSYNEKEFQYVSVIYCMLLMVYAEYSVTRSKAYVHSQEVLR